MSDLRVLASLPDRTWDAFVEGHPRGHVLQGSGWGRFRAGRGWRARRLAVVDADNSIVAGAQVLIRQTVGGSIGYVPRGPVCEPGEDAWSVLLSAMRDAVGRRGVFLRLEPNWPDDRRARLQLLSAGLVETDAVQPPSTVLVDLSLDEDALLAAMKQKWRYNVRLAARRGVTVRAGTDEDLPTLERLLDVTARRDGFPTRTGEYYADAYRQLGPRVARLHIAEHEGRTLAAVFVCHFGSVATYFYGASDDFRRDLMPNHLLQWEAMLAARAAGCRHYDFWGIPDEIGKAVVSGTDPSDITPGDSGLWGVWGFKRGFGGQVRRAVGAWDDVRSPLAHRVATRWIPRVAAVLRRRP